MPDLDRLQNELDFRAVEMLRAIAENGSGMTTTEIREATALDNSQVRYRRRKLEELDLLTTARATQTHGGEVQTTVHELTDAANKALSAGLHSRMQAPEPGNFEEMVEELTRLRTTVNQLYERVDGLEGDVDDLRSDSRKFRDDYESRVGDAGDVGQRLDDLESDAGELKEAVQDLDDRKRDKGLIR